MTTKLRSSRVGACAAVVLGLAAALTLEARAQHGAAATSGVNLALEAANGTIRLGKRWDQATFEETVRLYTPAHRDVAWPGVLDPERHRYGPAAQQNFDLFLPEQGFSEPGPVFVFVHGNGLGAADWQLPGSEGLLLAHAGRLAATAGGIGVLMNYRTGSDADRYSGAEDIRLVLEWLKANIADYGGDPETIVVLGNSEGATHLATYLFNEQSQLESGPGIAAAILSSGLFGAAAPHITGLVESYSGETVPLALWSAQYDVAEVETGIARLYAQLCEKLGDCPWYEQLYGYNHLSHLLSLGTSDTDVMNAFIRFYHTVR